MSIHAQETNAIATTGMTMLELGEADQELCNLTKKKIRAWRRHDMYEKLAKYYGREAVGTSTDTLADRNELLFKFLGCSS